MSCAVWVVCRHDRPEHYPELFAEGTADHAAAVELGRRTHELVSFLTRVMKVQKVDAQFAARATYHDFCLWPA